MTDADKGVFCLKLSRRERCSTPVRWKWSSCRPPMGKKAFMAHHVWCVKLLAEKGRVKIRETGAKDLKIIDIKGGHVDIKDRFVVYTDEAEWAEED